MKRLFLAIWFLMAACAPVPSTPSPAPEPTIIPPTSTMIVPTATQEAAASPSPTPTPDYPLCVEGVFDGDTSSINLSFSMGAEVTDDPMIVEFGNKTGGSGKPFVGQTYTCRLNQAGDFKPQRVVRFSFLVPFSFCEMDSYTLRILGTTRADFRSLELTINRSTPYFDLELEDVAQSMYTKKGLQMSWEGTAIYQANCGSQ